jgi:hypothetical protein
VFREAIHDGCLLYIVFEMVDDHVQSLTVAVDDCGGAAIG